MNNLFFAKLPEKELFDNPLGFCHVNGIHKPISYEIIRNDIYQVDFTDDGGFIHAETIGADNFDDVDVDDYVYLCFDVSYNPIARPVNVIRAKITAKADGDNITTDAVYVADGIGFVNIEHKNWYLETTVTVGSVISTIESRPDADFVIDLNIAPFLKIPPISMEDEFNGYPTTGTDDRNFYNIYTLSFLNNWKSNPNIATNLQGYTTADKLVGLNAVKQIQELNGNNFFEYFNHSINAGTSVCNLFISERPTFFKGFPFYYKHMIHIDDELFVLQAYQTLDDNSNPLKVLDSEDGYVNIVTIDQDLADTKTIDLKLVFFRIADSEPFDATRLYTIDVEDRCFQSPVYLNWLASDGSRYFWLFEIRQINGKSVKTNADFVPYYSDIETQNATSKDTNKTSIRSMTVGAYLPRNKFDWVKTILESINVNMLMNIDDWQDDGVVWQIIHPDNGNYPLDASDDTIIDFSFTFTLPQTNIQSE